jgi:Holliday junction DNA helicase RuvB
MNFQKLFVPWRRSREDIFCDDIIGHEDIKRLFYLVLRSEEPTHIVLSGPPASAKTMFLTSLRQHLKDSYFIDGGNATKAGIIDYLLENRAPCLLIDEIDKMSTRDQTFLLNLMETGIITETKYGKTREAEIKASVFATCNDSRKWHVHLKTSSLCIKSSNSLVLQIIGRCQQRLTRRSKNRS